VKAKGLRVIVIFEDRDGAGKGGSIRAITERGAHEYIGWSRFRLHQIKK
jgi:polyphosphate kinase 2 (PPK2 family)